MAKQRIDYLKVDRLDIQEMLVAGGTNVPLSNLTGGGSGELPVGWIVALGGASSSLHPNFTPYNNIVENPSKWLYSAPQAYVISGQSEYQYAINFPAATTANQYRVVFNTQGVANVDNSVSLFRYTSTTGTSWSTLHLSNVASGTFKFREQASYICRDFSNGDVYQLPTIITNFIYRTSGSTVTRSTLPQPPQFESYIPSSLAASNGVVSVTRTNAETGVNTRWYSSDFVNWQQATLAAGQSVLSGMIDDRFFSFPGTSTVWFLNTSGTTQYFSTDNGITYTSYTLPFTPSSSSYAFCVSSGKYILGNNSATLYTSTDLSSWTTVSTGLTNRSVSLFAIDSTEVFALSHSAETNSLFYSSNSGATWSTLTTNLPSTHAQKQILKIGSTYYIVTRDNNSGLNARMALYSSTDRTNWSLVFSAYTVITGTSSVTRNKFSISSTATHYNFCVDVVNNNIVVVTGRSLQYYDGTSWTQHSELAATFGTTPNTIIKIA